MKTKTLTYDYNAMLEAGKLLNQVTITGSANFRLMARIADILDSGTVGETQEPDTKPKRKLPARKNHGKEETANVLDKQAIHED